MFVLALVFFHQLWHQELPENPAQASRARVKCIEGATFAQHAPELERKGSEVWARQMVKKENRNNNIKRVFANLRRLPASAHKVEIIQVPVQLCAAGDCNCFR